MAQLVGQRCNRCSKVIHSILDGEYCAKCRQAVHHECKRVDTQQDAAAHCPGCGGDPSGSPPPSFPFNATHERTTVSGQEPPPESPQTVSPQSGAVAPFAKAGDHSVRLAEFQRTLATLTPRLYVTPILIGLNVAVFILMTASGVDFLEPKIADLLHWGADFGPKAVNGEWWRLLTSTFVHIGIIHILLNMWVLFEAGPVVERMVGNIGFLQLYLVAGLTGSLGSLLWHPLMVSAGASGAIFGIYGALLGMLVRSHGSIPTQVVAQLRKSGLGFLAYNLIFGMTQAGIDSAAHIGGLAGGFLCGVVLNQPFTLEALAKRPFRNLRVTGLGIVLIIVGIIGVKATNAEMVDLHGEKVQQGAVEVYYANGATKEEANRLGAYLAKTWGPRSDRANVQLTKTRDGFQIRMVIKKESLNDGNLQNVLEFQGARISRDVFNGASVDLNACDENFNTQKMFPHRPDARYGLVAGKAEVFFSADVNAEDAQRFADYLGTNLKEGPALVSYKLAKRGGIFEIHVAVRPDALNDPASISALRQDLDIFAGKVFRGSQVEMHLCDTKFNVVQVLKR